jgi:hyperosmotically inducible periplasmic protein
MKVITKSDRKSGNKFALLTMLTLAVTLAVGIGCNKANGDYHDAVKNALVQADLKEVNISEDSAKNTITLSGTLHSDDAKTRAGQIAQANAGPRVVANEISVEPVGNEGEAKKEQSNLDDGIENNCKANMVSKGLDKQHVSCSAKNGVLTLKGSVKTPAERKTAEQLAQNVPNVQQVVNEIQVQR